MTKAHVGVIGGSGFYQMDGISNVEELRIDTPFGAPSDAIYAGELEGVRVAFLARHGVGHRIIPTEVPMRANIWALKSLGVERIIAVNAVGSMREEMAPGHIVVPDQLIDHTRARPNTFFGRGLVAHIAFDQPFCTQLRPLLIDSARAAGATAHAGGTYIAVEGPAFSTKAETGLYRSWGVSIIGMTAIPEALLAREAEICYATLAFVTDYDTWHDDHEPVSAEMIIKIIIETVATARETIRGALRTLPAQRDCACGETLVKALITPADLVPEETKRDLAPILEKYLPVGAGGWRGR
jgi:5'-methylthioadenosine phosphorylase